MKTIAAIGLTALALMATTAIEAKRHNLSSPDGKLTLSIDAEKTLTYSLSVDDKPLLSNSEIAMKWSNGMAPGTNMAKAKCQKSKGVSASQTPFYIKERVEAEYNSVRLSANGYAIEFRLYNQGMVYRFQSLTNKPFDVVDETANFNFPYDTKAWLPYANLQQELVKGKEFECQFRTSFENTYTVKTLSEHDKLRLAFLPVLIGNSNEAKVCITESALADYPGMFVNAGNGKSLKGVFAPYPKELIAGGHNDLQMFVQEYDNYIAHVKGKRTFPWRIVAVSENDKELTNNDMVALLAEPSRVSDISWIKPGKVAWDWWNDLKLYGVDFEAGVNTKTYKYYIDFASANGIEYVILDEGWATMGKNDLFDIVPEIDLDEILAYAKSKSVGIILWAGYNAFAPDMDRICQHYAAKGVKGFKVDFMDRDDQEMVNFTWTAAQICAKHKMLLDLHGMFKPAGIQFTYPNVLNFEGVHGLEQMKWATADVDQVEYDVTLPFIRMVAGPMDYTQGAMHNANKQNFRSVFSEPMSQGTRCHQLAEYVVFTSPLNMLCDNPKNYEAEPECTEFIAKIPTVWDETIAIDGKVEQYAIVARRKGDTWYIGGLNNWTERNVEIDLSGVLGQGDYTLTIFADGKNANSVARDYKKSVRQVTNTDTVEIKMAQGGGFAMVAKRK